MGAVSAIWAGDGFSQLFYPAHLLQAVFDDVLVKTAVLGSVLCLGDPHHFLLGGAIAGKYIGGTLRQLALLPQLCKLRDQVFPDYLEPGQFAGGDLADLRHIVPHPAGELHALLFELIQQLFHLLRLGGLLSGGHGAGGCVGVDQFQLGKLRAVLGPVHDAGHLPQILPPVLVDQLFQRGMAAVAADDGIPVAAGPDQDWLLQANQRNV